MQHDATEATERRDVERASSARWVLQAAIRTLRAYQRGRRMLLAGWDGVQPLKGIAAFSLLAS